MSGEDNADLEEESTPEPKQTKSSKNGNTEEDSSLKREKPDDRGVLLA